MRRADRIVLLTVILVIGIAYLVWFFWFQEHKRDVIRVGVVYIGDDATAYTYNFTQAIEEVQRKYFEHVVISPKYNIHEGNEQAVLQELVDEGCDLIFTTSYGYGESAKEFAAKYPEIEFCQATCDNANTDPVLPNYHTFMGEIYQGRYICGVVAGMKLKDLIDKGTITTEQAKLGCVVAFPVAEVISGYTAFFLGASSIVPEVKMDVIYTYSWGNYSLEYHAAEELIENGCIVIGQDTDTKGAAVACEKAEDAIVYHIGYNQSMSEIAPTTNLTGCRFDWAPYFVSAVRAVLEEKKIEDVVEGNVHGNDVGAGFDKGWIEILPLNEVEAAPGTAAKVAELIERFKENEIEAFKGDYTGVNPFDGTTYDLRKGYAENKDSSAPRFEYVLKDVIRIIR